MSKSTDFHFRSRDGVAIFWLFFWIYMPGGILLGLPFMSWRAFEIGGVIFLALALGLNCELSITRTQAHFARRWFFIPYYWCTGAEVTSVSYDSDWDMEETATGVVVVISGKELHIGARKQKEELYSNLLRLAADSRHMFAANSS